MLPSVAGRANSGAPLSADVSPALLPMDQFAVGDRVIKSPLTWKANDFDEWGRGLGIGVVVEAPFRLEEGSVDVRWPCGRCFEDGYGLLPAPTAAELEILESLLDDLESIESLYTGTRTPYRSSMARGDLAATLVMLAKNGLAQPFNYREQEGAWVQIELTDSTNMEQVWFQATPGAKDCLYVHSR